MAVSQVVPQVRPSARTQAGFAALDLINVRDIFTQRACVMKVPPAFLRGAYRFVEASQGWQGVQERALGPVHQVRDCQWLDLLTQSVACAPTIGDVKSLHKLARQIKSGHSLDH